MKKILTVIVLMAALAISGTDADVASENLSKAADVDPYRYRVIFKPESIVPDIDFETSGGE